MPLVTFLQADKIRTECGRVVHLTPLGRSAPIAGY
jgi:hypothetical protein